MSSLNDAFGRVFCINLARRPDRWAHVEQECEDHGLTVERFEAIDGQNEPDKNNVNACTKSHRTVLEKIIHERIPLALILEDDFAFRFDDAQARFKQMVAEVPRDWRLILLGGHYQEAPKRRISPHVIEVNGMFTTSGYGVTLEAAKALVKCFDGTGAPDALWQPFLRQGRCYIFQPRLIVQYTNWSDLQGQVAENTTAMTDTHCEEMLLEGKWEPGKFWLHAALNREVNETKDLIGTEAIVDGKHFTILDLIVPAHSYPWRPGEPVTYFLKPL